VTPGARADVVVERSLGGNGPETAPAVSASSWDTPRENVGELRCRWEYKVFSEEHVKNQNVNSLRPEVPRAFLTS